MARCCAAKLSECLRGNYFSDTLCHLVSCGKKPDFSGMVLAVVNRHGWLSGHEVFYKIHEVFYITIIVTLGHYCLLFTE
jgi:hypothetical protein